MPRPNIQLLPFTTVGLGRSTGGQAAPQNNQYSDYFNGYFDSFGENPMAPNRTMFYTKRPFLNPHVAVTNLTTGSTNNNQKINGRISSLDNTSVIFVLTGTGGPLGRIYTPSATTNQTLPAGWSNTSSTNFTRLDGISYGANVFYAATDFTKGAVIDSSGVWTEITDADYTGLGTKTNFVGNDGYLFFGVTSGTGAGRLYNMDLNTATSLTATSFVNVQDTPGKIMWLIKIRNYIVVMKQYSLEFFEDVGNPTPGSPLGSQKQLNRKIGLANPGSVQEVSDGFIFVGVSETGTTQVFHLSKINLQLTPISDSKVEASLMNFVYSGTAYFPPYTAFGIGSSQVINIKNKEIYALTTYDNNISTCTYIWDHKLKVWTRWYSLLGGTDNQWFDGSQAFILQTTTHKYIMFACNTPAPSLFYAFTEDDGSASSENGFKFGFTTDTLDFGTRVRKFLDSLEIIIDNTPAGTGLSRTFSFSYMDDDFLTAIIPRTINYTVGGTTRLRATRLGNFRSRSFTFFENTELSNTRIISVELDLNNGETEE